MTSGCLNGLTIAETYGLSDGPRALPDPRFCECCGKKLHSFYWERPRALCYQCEGHTEIPVPITGPKLRLLVYSHFGNVGIACEALPGLRPRILEKCMKGEARLSEDMERKLKEVLKEDML
jgi:hypothetical protein